MKSTQVIQEVLDNYGEWIEMASEHDAGYLLLDMMACIIIKERNEKEFYRKLAYGTQAQRKN